MRYSGGSLHVLSLTAVFTGHSILCLRTATALNAVSQSDLFLFIIGTIPLKCGSCIYCVMMEITLLFYESFISIVVKVCLYVQFHKEENETA